MEVAPMSSGGEGGPATRREAGIVPASRRACSPTIVVAVAMVEEVEVEAIVVVITVLDARHLMSIFVRLGAGLQAGEREQANSGRARQRDDVLAHGGFLLAGGESIQRQWVEL